jgi:hypothetical protein
MAAQRPDTKADEVRWKIIGLIGEISEIELAQFAGTLHDPTAEKQSVPIWMRDFLSLANAYELGMTLPLLLLLASPAAAQEFHTAPESTEPF